MTSKLAHLIAKQQPLALQHALSPAKRLLLFNNTTGRAFSCFGDSTSGIGLIKMNQQQKEGEGRPTSKGMLKRTYMSLDTSNLRPTTSPSNISDRLNVLDISNPLTMGAASSRTISVDSGDGLSDISFRIVDQSRYPEIMKLLYANFHTDEPMSKSVGMIGKDGASVQVLDDFTLDGLKQNLSIMAIDPLTDNLLGVSVNIEAKKEDNDATLEQILEHYDHPKFKHILTVLYRVNEKAGDIFAEFETDVFFDIKMVTTDKNQRRGGLATDLLRRSVELARNLGFKAVKTEATGLYSRKAFERLGFSVNAEYLYEDYVSEEGEKIFEPIISPHRCTTLMTKRLFAPIEKSTIKEK